MSNQRNVGDSIMSIIAGVMGLIALLIAAFVMYPLLMIVLIVGIIMLYRHFKKNGRFVVKQNGKRVGTYTKDGGFTPDE